MTELAATLREALAALAASDPERRRFGAAEHRYELLPPRALDVPDPELAAFVATVGSGGAGPYHGWISVERALAAIVEAPAGVTAWTRALPLAHLGCGYAAVLALDGEARGEVWLDARARAIVRPIHPSFTAFYLDWIDRLARGRWPESHVPADACALPHALSGYLSGYEHVHGLEPGTLSGAALAEALARLAPGSIEIAGEPPLFAPGDRVAPCVACARMLENLGLPASVVAPGVPPLAVR